MGMLGYIKDGRYVSNVSNDYSPKLSADNPQFKAGDHERQRKEYAKEILQPYNKDGTINEDFVSIYPDIAKEKGFIPEGDPNG